LEGNHEHIKQRLEQHLESRKSNIESEAYQQFSGLKPVISGRNNGNEYGKKQYSNDSRPSITQENRHDVGLKGNIVIQTIQKNQSQLIRLIKFNTRNN